jgi:hypothetical protein
VQAHFRKPITRALSRWSWLAVVLSTFGAPAPAALRQGPLVGRKAPPFHIAGIYNEPYSLEMFKGHVLILQFGTSW